MKIFINDFSNKFTSLRSLSLKVLAFDLNDEVVSDKLVDLLKSNCGTLEKVDLSGNFIKDELVKKITDLSDHFKLQELVLLHLKSPEKFSFLKNIALLAKLAAKKPMILKLSDIQIES